MFYDVFDNLCKKNNTTPYSVAIKLGFSRSTPAYWKRSGSPPKREYLEKIAEYFGVPVESLLGRETEKPAPLEIKRSELSEILSQLSDAELDEWLRYGEYLAGKNSKK
jgi:transcriptional regulator with XRE-family HTH domain